MFEIDIPGFGLVRLEHLVTDFTGTLSIDGTLELGIREQLSKISEFLKEAGESIPLPRGVPTLLKTVQMGL